MLEVRSYKELGRSLKVKYFIAFELNVERSCKFFVFLSCCFFGRVIVPPHRMICLRATRKLG